MPFSLHRERVLVSHTIGFRESPFHFLLNQPCAITQRDLRLVFKINCYDIERD